MKQIKYVDEMEGRKVSCCYMYESWMSILFDDETYIMFGCHCNEDGDVFILTEGDSFDDGEIGVKLGIVDKVTAQINKATAELNNSKNKIKELEQTIKELKEQRNVKKD